LFRREPAWRGASPLGIPAAFLSWLEETGSLTARLRRSAGAGFGVRLLGQCRTKPFHGESVVLHLPSRSHTLTREVLLYENNQPLVLARTVIPSQALQGKHCALAKLGNRPLGEVLFAQRSLRRSRLDYARIVPMDWLPAIADAYTLEKPLWGRRSLYEIDTVSLLVCEFFLPAALSLEEA
jgi:chorismate--pyruvate lyase